MDFNEFLQFHQVNSSIIQHVQVASINLFTFFVFQFKNSTVILHCEVETKEYKRFTRPFITDKHISVIQWEEIIRKTEQEICKYLKKSVRFCVAKQSVLEHVIKIPYFSS